MKEKYDVIVCGGGFAGCAAAIRAAREGMNVLLIEKSGFLSGAAGNCNINPFMPFSTKIDGKSVNLSAGIFEEIIAELARLNGFRNKDGAIFSNELLKLVLDRMTVKSGADVLFHTYIANVQKDKNEIKYISCVNKSGMKKFYADIFIDATGDADIAALADCPFSLGRESDNLCQPMTLCFDIANVDIDGLFQKHGDMNKMYAEKQSKGEIKNPRGDVLCFRHMANGILHVNSTRIIKKSPVDAEDLTQSEQIAREQVFELFSFLKENFDACKDAVLLSSGPEIGIRESRKIEGKYILTVDDLKACTKFEDGIAACNYDIDIHDPAGGGTSHYYFKEGTYYTIPYRCLLPQGTDNLLVAGRCISGTHEAQASFRIMPVCCTLGEAAGTAAAIAKKDNCKVDEIDINKLRNTLKKNGAFI